MVRLITELKIPRPRDKISEINPENFVRYLNWQQDKKQLSKWVLGKFKQSVCAATGFSDAKIPKEETKTSISVDNLDFIVTTKKRTRNPAYTQVLEKLEHYLRVTEENFSEGLRAAGVRKINNVPYLMVGRLLQRIKTYEKESKEGRDSVQHSVQLIKPQRILTACPEELILDYTNDYSELTGDNGTMYVHTTNFIKIADCKMSPLKELLKQDSLKALEMEEEDLDMIVALEYPADNMNFVHQMEPRMQVPYKQLIRALSAPQKKTITKKSKIGDLVKVNMLGEHEDIMRDRGLLDETFNFDYLPVRRKGRMYVRLRGIIARLERYKEELSKPGIEQNIYIRPN